MIHPPQVGLEEPIAVTPHDGICGGESQQWLSYPTNPHVRFDERGRETGCCRMAQATAPVLDSTPLNRAGLEQVKAVEPHTRFGCLTLETQRNGYWLADLARERPSASLDEARHRVVLRHGANKVWLELATKQVERGPILD